MARYACVIEDWPLPDPDDDDVRDLLPGSEAIAVVALDGSGAQIGAAWTFAHTPPLLIDHDAVAIPEIAMAVQPDHRDGGVGGALLDELFTRSATQHTKLCLNVHQRNPAQRLYERKGFRHVGQGRGTLGIAMVKEFDGN